MKKRSAITTVVPFLFLSFLVSETLFAASLQSDSGISGDIFGRHQRALHLFLDITEKYTDNFYNADIFKESEKITTISPGLVLALPGADITDIDMSASTAAPGGFSMTRYKMETDRQYQGILVYNPEFELYDEHRDENFTSQKLKGAFQYNTGGLTLDIADSYRHAQEMRGDAGNPNPDTYDANVIHAIAEFAFSPMLSVGIGEAYNSLSYRETDFRDRSDTFFSGWVNLNLSSKTKLFCEYQYIDVEYDSNASALARDNQEDLIYGGISWKMTAKTRGTCKLGYMSKDFKNSAVEDLDDLTGEIRITHELTPRTLLMLNASRKYYETNLTAASCYTADRISAAYFQAFTPKLMGSLSLSYGSDDYNGIDLEADTYMARPALTFEPTRWLSFELAYSYTKRRAEKMPVMDYRTNEYTFKISGKF